MRRLEGFRNNRGEGRRGASYSIGGGSRYADAADLKLRCISAKRQELTVSSSDIQYTGNFRKMRIASILYSTFKSEGEMKQWDIKKIDREWYAELSQGKKEKIGGEFYLIRNLGYVSDVVEGQVNQVELRSHAKEETSEAAQLAFRNASDSTFENPFAEIQNWAQSLSSASCSIALPESIFEDAVCVEDMLRQPRTLGAHLDNLIAVEAARYPFRNWTFMNF